MQFKPSWAYSKLYLHHKIEKSMFILDYGDDNMVTGNEVNTINEVVDGVKKKFEAGSRNDVKRFPEIVIESSLESGTVKLHCKELIENLFKSFQM